MNTTVERLEGNQVKLTMTVPADEVDTYIKQTYREVARKNNFPGFRKGKAPRKVIDSFVGKEYILGRATEDLVNELFPRAIDSEDLRPIKDADFGDMKDVSVADGEDFTITATITDTPQLELSSYDPVEISLISDEATEAEVNDQIETLAKYYFSLEEVEREAKTDDLATIDITTTYGEVEIPAYTATDRTFEVGGLSLPEEIDSQIVGMKVGDHKEFDFVAPAGSLASVDAKEGDTFHAVVDMKELREKVYPAIDDEFAKERGGFESLADMKAKVAESISSQKKQLIPRLKEQECGRAIAARLEGDVPAEMVASTQQQLLRDFFVNLQRQGMTFDAYLRAQDLTSAQFQEDVKKQADDVTRESLALDALARHLGFDATDEDIDKEFAESGVKDPAATRKEWEDEGRMAFIREGVRRSKASDWLLENAVVTVKDPEAEDEDKPAEEPEKAAEAPAED